MALKGSDNNVIREHMDDVFLKKTIIKIDDGF